MNQDIQQDNVLSPIPPGFSPPLAMPEVVAPIVKKRSPLAIWTLVLNLVYYSAPIVLIGIIATVFVLGRQTPSDNMGYAIAFIFGMILFSIITSTIGLATVVLDIIYLVKIKPIGVKRALTIASLCLFGLVTVVVPLLVSLFQSHM